MRVTMLGQRGFPGVQGGVESHVEHLCPLLVESGCEVRAIVRTPAMPRGGLRIWRGVQFVRIWSPTTPGVEAVVHSLLGVIYAIFKRPDILHVQALGSSLWIPLVRLFGLRVVFTHHSQNYDWQSWSALARATLRFAEWTAVSCANATITVSEPLAQVVKHHYGVETTTIRNGVEVSALALEETALQRFGLARGRYVLFVGRLAPKKRLVDLVQAFAMAHLDGWKLVIVGGSGHSESYAAEVAELAQRTPGTVLTGFQSGAVLAQLFTHAGLFVLPSSHEGMPIALLEALAYGIPATASDIPASREIALASDAYFPVGDAAQIAAAMRRVADRNWCIQQRDQLRRRIAADRSWSEVAIETLAVYRWVAQRRTTRNGKALEQHS